MIVWRIPSSISISTQLSPPEAIAVVSSLSLVAATAYNVGFFAPTDASLIYLLSPQDLLLGTALAVVPVASALFMAMSAIRAVSNIGDRAPWWVLPCVAVACSTLTYFSYANVTDQNYTVALNLAYFVVLALAAWANKKYKWKPFAAATVAFSVLYFTILTGYTGYHTSVNEDFAPKSSVLLSNSRNIEGVIFRYTSGYVFLHNETFSIIPSGNVLRITSLPRTDGAAAE